MLSIRKWNDYRKHHRNEWAMLCLVLLLASCTSVGSATKPACPPPDARAACAWLSPIKPSKDDILTDITAKMIDSYDDAGAKLCGWK